MSNRTKIKKKNTPHFLTKFVKKNCKYLTLDLKDGILYSYSLPTSLVEVYSLTSKLAEGVYMRNWFWVARDQVSLVNTELKFKIEFNKRSSIEDHKSSRYVGIGSGLTAQHLQTVDQDLKQVS